MTDSKLPVLELPAALRGKSPPDPRLNLYRKDAADSNLRGIVEARAFLRGAPAQICVPVADLYKSRPKRGRAGAQARAGAETQLLYGARAQVFERRGGYAWLQAENDLYVGYVKESALCAADSAAKSGTTAAEARSVAVPRSFVYSEADLRSAPLRCLSLGSEIAVIGEETRRGTRYALLQSGGAMIAEHLRPQGSFARDYVSVAESLLRTPYLWGGSSAFGIDCSGLVQLALAMAGRRVLRDSDMQAESIGARLSGAEPHLQRGDLVFWRGHVAIMQNSADIIHANGHKMMVSTEPLRSAAERIAQQHGAPLAFRRP